MGRHIICMFETMNALLLKLDMISRLFIYVFFLKANHF